MNSRQTYPQHSVGLGKFLTKKWLIIGGVVSLLLIIGIVLLTTSMLQRDFPKYNLNQTNLWYQNNFGYLQGSELFTFNGLSFYKIDLETGKKTVLSNGQRLPKPREVHWAGSNGALMTFSSSFSLTPIENALRAEGKELDLETRDYTWYLDFATGTVKMVDIEPPLAKQVYYSASENGFYYIPDQSTYPEPMTPLMFYDIAAGHSTYIESDLALAELGSMSQCSDDVRICVIMRDGDDPTSEKLYGFSENTKKKLLIDSGGQIFPTNDPHRFVTVTRESENENTSVDPTLGTVDHVDEADITEAPASLRDIKASKTYDLGFEVGTGEPVLHFVDSKRFYVLDSSVSEAGQNNTSVLLYRSGELSGDKAESNTYPLTLASDDTFTGQIVHETSHGKGSNVLVATLDGDQFIMSGEKDLQGLEKPEGQVIVEAVSKCTSRSMANDSQFFKDSHLMRVFFTVNNSFAPSVKRFGECMAKSKVSPFHGYDFQITGTDAATGRIWTD